ncbi:MAG: ABC transporter ATP-binding protein [Bacteroidales bacterium]|nr:ABC transporter ATP-binding protein [Bacteroidales bacterium]
MFGLLGPNGAGKSTLMRILVTLMRPTRGSIHIDGKDIHKHRKEVRKMIGYLPQDFRFFSKLKTWEFLDYSAALSGITNKKKRDEAVDQMLEEVGLYDARDRQAGKLSGGMKRRLGIAQALINDPRLIVVDEPTTGLDPDERIRFRNLLSKISGEDRIIILSTHIVADISSTCNQMALLNQGNLAYQGTPEELVNKARGSVWKVILTTPELEKVKEQHPVISTVMMEEGWEVILVADDLAGYPGEKIEPDLEHAYVHFMDRELNEYMLADF